MQTINSNTATIVFNSKGLETLSETLISKNYASLFVLQTVKGFEGIELFFSSNCGVFKIASIKDFFPGLS